MFIRRGMRIGLIIGAAFAGSSATPPTSARAQSASTALSQGLDAIAQKHGVGRMWLFVEQGHTVVANIGIRGANADEAEPVGSLSKSITGIGIALLIQEGKLSLNSKMGDVLAGLYAQHNRPMDEKLKSVTVERLLTHTAGLRGNKYADPSGGFTTAEVLQKLGSNPDIFDFLNASDGDHSTGQSSFLYSNMSYLMLGLVIEAVSGQKYGDFCRSHILGPLGINASLLGGRYSAISPYGGWVLTRHDLAEIWLDVFNTSHPSILTNATLRRTLFASLGQRVGKNHDAHYVMGTYVRGNPSAYSLSHDGEQNTKFLGGDTYVSYVEDLVPGSIWMIAITPRPSQDQFSAIISETRQLVAASARN